jgi:DnaJ like chaperone protein
MNFVSKLSGNFFYAGVFGLLLSAVFSEYTSQFLYAKYQGWIGWRSLTGNDPNYLTLIIQKISWAGFFFTSWYMLWKFDSFFRVKSKSMEKQVDQDEKVHNEEPEDLAEEKKDKPQSNLETEREPVNESPNDSEPVREMDTGNIDNPNEIKFSFVDIKYAELLGLTEPFKLEDIKPAYRKLIAQYHPDRVAAMGEEIRTVAEKKAKEINRTYDYFQKKFDLN